MKRARVVVFALFCLAPTAGDVGSCGSTTTLLDVPAFAAAKKRRDCDRCRQCALDTTRCRIACNEASPASLAIPPSCVPLDHDGDVCLRALAGASCDAYARYVDETPSLPSECAFCRLNAPPVPTGFATDASAEGGP
jgi:hypothetical protein